MASEWCEVRVGDLVNQGALWISDGYRVRNEELGPVGVPFVRGGDIGDGWINTRTEDHIRPEFIERVRGKLTQPEDAAFITKGTVGRAGRLRPEQPSVVFAPQVAYWRVMDRSILDPAFIFYLMRSYEFQSALDGVKTHGAMVADYVSISQQYDFRFRLPNVETQRRVGYILGKLDDKIELNRQMSETLDAMARALFMSWFVDFDPVRAKAEGRDAGHPKALIELFPAHLVESELGEIPEGWQICTLGDIAELDKGLSYKGEGLVSEGGLPLVNLGCFAGEGRFRPENIKQYYGDYRDRHLVRAGDLLIANTDMTQNRIILGSPALLPDVSAERRYLFSHHTFAVRFNRGAERWKHHVYFSLLRPEFREIAEGYATGTTVLALPRDGVIRYQLVLPPEPLRAAFEQHVSALLVKAEATSREARVLTTLRDALLPKLMSGDLQVKAAERILARASA